MGSQISKNFKAILVGWKVNNSERKSLNSKIIKLLVIDKSIKLFDNKARLLRKLSNEVKIMRKKISRV